MKKLLVWDGDECLWDGTIVEGDEVKLPLGRYELCKELHDRGVVQSIASHNLLKDVEQTLHRLGLSNFFLMPQAEFGTSKSAMIVKIVEGLGLSKMEDVVFVDDQPFNRAEVFDALSGIEVTAPEIVQEAVDAWFTKDEYTDVDRNRVAMYRAEQLRKESGKAYGDDKQSFLRSCEMRMRVGHPSEGDMSRVVDLVRRANRMAAASGEFDAEALEEARLSGSLMAMWASDRFGDYGLSGVVLDNAGHIDLLVVSCRLQGKGYGSAMLGWVINKHVGELLQADWDETEYNAGVKSLYEWYGFGLVTSSVGWEGGKPDPLPLLAVKQIVEPVELPGWIEVEG